ncbi:hypothetical protein ACTXT7_017116, partial [Hymenolepis weldensis]
LMPDTTITNEMKRHDVMGPIKVKYICEKSVLHDERKSWQVNARHLAKDLQVSEGNILTPGYASALLLHINA